MPELEVAHIWAAKFDSEHEQDEIFQELEVYGDDQEPISKFANSQGEWFYDHDFFYIEEKKEFFDRSDIQENYMQQIKEKWNDKVPGNFEFVIVGDEEDFKNPKSCKIQKSELIYVGKFKHW